MTNQPNEPNTPADRARAFRQRAEEKLSATRTENLDALSLNQSRQLLHELQVHQIELEMQNDELRRAHEELDETRARYFDLYDLAPVGYLTLSEQGLILQANRTGAILLGVPHGTLVKQPLTQFITAEDQDIFYQCRRQLLATGEPQVCELRMIRRGANDLTFWARVQVTVGQDGATGATVCRAIFSDISESKRAEKEIAESEEKFRAVAESAADALISIDRHGIITFWNRAAEKLFGYPVEEILGQPLTTIMPEQYQLAHQTGVQRVVATHTSDLIGKIVELVGRKKSGSEFPMELSLAEWQMTGQVFFTAIIRDITARKQAEDALRESEDKFKYVFDHSIIGKSLTLISGEISVNTAFCDMLGYTQAELENKRWQDITHPDDILPTQQVIDRLVSGEQGSARFSKRYIHKSGAVVWVDLSTSLRRDKDGTPLYFITSLNDITERKRAEDALRQSEEKFAKAFQTSPYAVTITRQDGEFLEVNDAFTVMTGFTREEALASSSLDLNLWVNEAERNEVGIALGTGQGIFGKELSFRTKRGQVITGLFSAQLIEINNATCILSSIGDITERKRAENALRESEAQLKSSQQVAHVGHWTWDTQTNLVAWSDEMYRVFGLDPATFTGDLQSVIDQAIHPDDRAKVNASNTAVVTEQKPAPLEYRVVWRDQSVHTVFAVPGEKIVDATGNILKLSGVVQDITERKRHERELEAVVLVSGALRAAITRDEMMPVVVEQISLLLNAHGVAIGLFAPNEDASVVMGANGGWAEMVGLRIPLEGSISGRVLTTGKPYITHDLAHEPMLQLPHYMEDLQSGACVPLIAQGQAIGWLFAGVLATFHDDDLRILNAIADIVANAIRRAALHERTQQTAVDLERAYETTLEGWANALELRDQETNGHTRRVVHLTLELAQVMGIPPGEIVHLRRGALLHDIGKMGIPDSVLLKHGTLNDREWEIMQRHAEYAYRLLLPIEYLYPALDIPYCHHEKWDGTGYPRGLKGEEIPLAARLFAIVDVWDALCSDRPYRTAWSVEKARAYIRAETGKQFDPQVAEAFLNLVAAQ